MPGQEREQEDLEGFSEGSRYAAHLDRGWSLFEKGDFAAARMSALHAQTQRSDAPDAVVLLAALALAEGEPDEALRMYDKAIELDPDFAEPYLSAAQIALVDLDDPVRAVQYCDQALENTDPHPLEAIELHLVAIEAYVIGDEPVKAKAKLDAVELADDLREVLLGDAESPEWRKHLLGLLGDAEELDDEELPEVVQRLVHHGLRLARLWLDLGAPRIARKWLRELVDRYPEEPDAWYLLGEAELSLGDARRAACAALRTLQLDAQFEMPDWAPDPKTLYPVVLSVVREWPELAPFVKTDGSDTDPALVVLVHDAPAVEVVLEGLDPRAPVLVVASRSPDAPPNSDDSVITGIAIYLRNLARLSGSTEKLHEELKAAIQAELAPFFDREESEE